MTGLVCWLRVRAVINKFREQDFFSKELPNFVDLGMAPSYFYFKGHQDKFVSRKIHEKSNVP